MQDFIQETESGIYRITRDGRVFTQTKLKVPLNTKGREFSGKFKHILQPEREMAYTLNNRGYLSVGIRKKTYMVHRLVALAFLKKPIDKDYVNHKDGNKLNNHVDNLEWCTIKENNQHARDTGLWVQPKGHKLVYKSKESKAKALANLKDKSKLTHEQVKYVREKFIPRHPEYSATALAKQFGTSVAAMTKIVKKTNLPRCYVNPNDYCVSKYTQASGSGGQPILG